MSDTPQSLAAILAEMRDGIHTGRADIIDIANERLRSYADRIEAAAKREAIGAELKWTRIGYDERKAEEKRAPGNAALREALEQAKRDHWFDMSPDLRNKIFAALAAPPEPPSNAAAMRAALLDSNGLLREIRGEWSDATAGQIADNNAALAAPPRNCDCTKDEAEDLFKKRFGRPWTQTEDELAAFLFAPAEGGAE